MKTLTQTFEELFTTAAELGKDARVSAFVQDAIFAVEKYNKQVVGKDQKPVIDRLDDDATLAEFGAFINGLRNKLRVQIRQKQEELL